MKLEHAEVMAYPRGLVEQTILGLQPQINRHLIKLTAYEFPAETRRHFRRELRTWLRDIQTVRFKPDNRSGSFKFYFDLLYDFPFGGVEVQNVRILMRGIADDYQEARAIKSPEEVVEWLRGFHGQVAERLHKGEDVLDLIPE